MENFYGLNMKSLLKKKKCRGWIYSWYVYDSKFNNSDPTYFVVPIHESLEKEAKSHVEKESSINEIIIQISAYINKILTVYDQDLSYAHVALPPFLHPVIKEFMIGLDTGTEIKFQLTENELKGKEELYALNLLEMTGD